MSMGSELLDEYAFEMMYPFGQPSGADPQWKGRSGAIKVSQMSDRHIRNCMRIVGEDDDWYYVFQKELKRRGYDNA